MLSLRAGKQLVSLKRVFFPAVASCFSTSSERVSAVKNVTVIGSGLMGAGIAQVLYDLSVENLKYSSITYELTIHFY